MNIQLSNFLFFFFNFREEFSWQEDIDEEDISKEDKIDFKNERKVRKTQIFLVALPKEYRSKKTFYVGWDD